MELIRRLQTLLRTLTALHEVDIDDLKPTSKPSWAVTYEGQRRHGNAWKAVCRVHVFLGPAYRPDIELVLAAAVETVGDALLTTGDMLGDWDREAEEELHRVPFAHLSCEVAEA